jgi:hypothetical protein
MTSDPPPAAAEGVSSSSSRPLRHHEQLPGPLGWLHYDGVSPFATQQPKAEGSSLQLTLQGRGSQNPLKGVSGNGPKTWKLVRRSC